MAPVARGAGGLRQASNLAFATFFINSVALASTAVAFRGNPRLGTLFNMSLSAIILACLAIAVAAGAVRTRRLHWSVASTAAVGISAWIALSLFWTDSYTPASAAAYTASMLVELMVVLALATIAPASTLVLRAMQGYILGSVVVLGLVIALGMHDASGRLGDEAYLHPNALGFHVAVAALFAIFLASYRGECTTWWSRRFWLVVALICVGGLAATLSKTAIAAFGGGVLVLFLRGEMSRASRAIAVLLGGAIVVISSGTFDEYWHEYAGTTGTSLRTLTGRTDIWAQTWPRIAQDPWFGHGVLSFRDVGPQIAEVRLVHAHNEAIQLLFTSGVVGLTLAVLAYSGLAFQLRRSYLAVPPGAVSYRSVAYALLVFTLLRGLTEASETTLVYPLDFLLLFSFWGAATLHRSTTMRGAP
jgi:O-antigen ligase